jgi:hypothetical protein
MLTACLLLILREGTEDPVGEMDDLCIHHSLAGLRILREWRVNAAGQQRAEHDTIIDDIEPALAQIEFVMAMFCPAALAVVLQADLARPQLPELFADHIQMQDTFSQIHRWRYQNSRAGESWTASSPLFKDIQALLKEWYRLAAVYLSNHSISFLQRRTAVVMWSQYRMLCSVLVFSQGRCS